MNVNFTPQALEDLSQIKHYIAEHDERAADRVISRIRQVIQMFESFPLLGREGMVEGTREFAVPGLSYVIVYQIVSATDLDIVAITHDRRQFPPTDN